MGSFQKKFLEFSKPFLAGADSVFETMIFTKIKCGRPQLKENNQSPGEISAVMGLSGVYGESASHFKGMFVLSFPEVTYLNIAGSMLQETYTEFSDEVADVGAEISNIITGNAKRVLAESGYQIGMSIPSTIYGANHRLSYPSSTEIVQVPVSSELGNFYIEICYKEES